MKVTSLMSCLILTHVARINADEVTIKGVHFNKETLSNWSYVSELSVDENSSSIYFKYDLYEGNDTWWSNLGIIHLKEKKTILLEIPGVDIIKSHAIDHKNNVIYVGSSNGIYKYNTSTSATTYYGASGMNIQQMYFNNALYFKSSGTNTNWYVFQNGTYSKFEQLQGINCWRFIIDVHNDTVLYFINYYRVFKSSASGVEVINFNSLKPIWNVAQHPNGQVYLLTSEGVYLVDSIKLQVEQLFPLTNGFYLTFDKSGNMIYSDWITGVYRLVDSSGSMQYASSLILISVVLVQYVLSL